MAGREDFSQPGSKGSGQTIAQQERFVPSTVEVNNTSSLASGGTEQVEVYAPTGSIYRCRALWFTAPADGTATSGDYRFQVRPMNKFSQIGAKTSYTDGINLIRSAWDGTYTYAQPPDSSLMTAIRSLIADENNPIVFKYLNQTDAAQDNRRQYMAVLREDTY